MRTVQDIQNEIIKSVNTYLPELTHNKKSKSIWRLWTYVVSMAIWTFEKLFYLLKEDVDNIVTNKRIGNLAWYNKISKEFQYGYDLKINQYGEYYYTTIDPSVQIISVASCVYNQQDRGLTIKVAKFDSKEKLIKLSAEEKEKFTAYMEKVQIVGTYVKIVSENADELVTDMRIYSSKLIDKEKIEKKVKDRIDKFLTNLPFDGVFNTNDFIDYIRGDDDIDDVVIDKIYVMEGTLDVYFDRVYTSRAGYIIFNDSESKLEVL